MGALDVLRSATRTLHEQIDGSDFARAVLEGTIAVPRYASFLRAVHAVLAALETTVEVSGAPALRDAYAHGVERRARLTHDLAYLQVDPHAVDGAVLRALVLAQRLRLDARHGPARLLGYLYVMEGSQLGGLFQKKSLEARPEFQGGGLSYLAGAGRDTQPQFRAFVTKLEAALTDEASVASAVIGATHAFEGFQDIVSSVMSPNLDGRWLTEPLNPDAGTHPIPRDVREVQAALRAGEQSYHGWAYYQARYGARGLAFTRSDSCWLATLVRDDPTLAQRQVRWLAGVLASRGMPTLLIEQHLELLHDALASLVPERAHSYEPLRTAAHALRTERLGVLDDARLRALASGFDGASPHLTAHEAGTLLVAAVIDEKRGYQRVVESLVSWLADGERFTPAWRAAVERTLEAARAAH